MSTKIYTAWRMPIGVFAKDFMTAFQEHCLNKVALRLEELIGAVEEKVMKDVYDKHDWSKRLSWEDYVKQRGKQVKARHVLKYSYLASDSYERSLLFDMDCSFNAWIHNNKVYVIPYGESWILNGFDVPEKVEDYCYYNNADQPENLTRRQWDARAKTWDKICLDNHGWNRSRLLHEIVNIKEGMGNVEIWRKKYGESYSEKMMM